MHVAMVLSPDDIADTLGQSLPLEIELGKSGAGERFVAVDAVNAVSFVPNEGVRIQCAGHLRWPVLGVGVPVRIHRLGILVLPTVRTADDHESLVFKLKIEDADIAWLPALADQSIADRVNRDLAAHDAELAWNFSRTLSHVFALPAALRTAAAIGLYVTSGQVTITESLLGLTVQFRTSVNRRSSEGA